MSGVTSVEVKERLEEISQLIRQSETPQEKERLQVLYWLKQDNPPTIGVIAQGIGKHRNTVQTWLLKYREGGVEAMLEVKKAPGQERIIPKWAEASLAKRLADPEHGFASYGAVQQWLAESLGIEAEYHTVYQMTHYRLNAKLKVARPQNNKQNVEQRETFKKTLQTICPY